jgi:hypothetical protein
LLLAYLNWADGYYAKNGQPTTEPVNIRLALPPVVNFTATRWSGDSAQSPSKPSARP